jgi:hypothetical protein
MPKSKYPKRGMRVKTTLKNSTRVKSTKAKAKKKK